MDHDPQVKAFRRKILTEREVRLLVRGMKRMMGEPFVSAAARCRLSLADTIRFMAVSARLTEAREARGLTAKALAALLRAPKYRVADIEGGSAHILDASVLARYIDLMGLREWFRQWQSANPGLAKRLAVPDPGARTAPTGGGSRASRRLRSPASRRR